MNQNDVFAGYLLISDIDGTLLPRGGQVSPENRAAVEQFVAGGGHFAIATGRTPEAAAGYVSGLPVNAPSIFFNGGLLYDWQAAKPLLTRPLPSGTDASIWPRFAQLCRERLPEACIEVYTADNCNIISDPVNDDPRLPHEYYKYSHVPLAEISDLAATPWLKFFVNDAPERLRQVERWAEESGLSALANSFYSEANYYEFVAQGTSKGAMLRALRKLPEWQDYQIIAAGDYLNDNEMLMEADIGVASGNAHDDTKNAADIIGCRAEEHLMAWIVEHWTDLAAGQRSF